jgi:hypothetical protein
MLSLKISLSGSISVTIILVSWPIGFLAFTGTVGYRSASTTIHRFDALYPSVGEELATLSIVANANFCNMLHFLVFFIEARAGNPASKEFYERVFVSKDRQFLNFHPIY